jgi:hypothetical protein
MRKSGAILDLELTPYPMWLHLYTDRGRYRRAVNAAVRNHVACDSVRNVDGLCSVKDGVIWVGVFDGDGGTLVHELTHAAEHIAEYIELPRGWRNIEPIAHLMGFMFRRCSAALKGTR